MQRVRKRFWVIYDADGDLHRSQRINAQNRRQAIQVMRALYGNDVRIRCIQDGF